MNREIIFFLASIYYDNGVEHFVELKILWLA